MATNAGYITIPKIEVTSLVNKVVISCIATLLVLGAVVYFNAPKIIAEHAIHLPGDFGKKQLLEKTYNDYIAAGMKNDYKAMYAFLAPSEKAITSYDEYKQIMSSNTPDYNQEVTINSIEVKDDIGIIDRTVSFCRVKNCDQSERIVFSGKKQFYYVNNTWVMYLDSNIYCERTVGHSMAPEFDRAISLIMQRLTEYQDKSPQQNATRLLSIKNCLYIQYAVSEEDMGGAEGVFSFSKNSSNDMLTIFVSQRYQVKDDLVTAILLSHEITHAYLFAAGQSILVPCFENEALAYLDEMQFVSTLNSEEKASLAYRYNNNTSEEVTGLISVLNTLNATPGATPMEKALNYVQSVPYYQNQCAGN